MLLGGGLGAVAAVRDMVVFVNDGVGLDNIVRVAVLLRVRAWLYLHVVAPAAGFDALSYREDALDLVHGIAGRHHHVVGNLQFPGQEFLAFATNIIATANGTTAYCLTGVAVLTGNGYHGTPVDVGVASPAMD